ncbi:hypothetical protein B5S32_g3018 [[Candida] boidinii]|nr:hypothetical protein B5S32_g3018 [[Candida] boidinii]
MSSQRVKIIIPRRFNSSSSSFFGNLGDSLKKVVPKPHQYFQVTKPLGFNRPPVLFKDIPRKKFFTAENLNFPKRLWNFYFDGITRRTKVAAIQKDLAYGGMYDFHVYMKTKGKLFLSPPSYFKKEKALYFPNFKVKSLTGKNVEVMKALHKSEITILRIYSTESGADATKNYFNIPNSEDTYLSDSGIDILKQSFPHTQIVQMVLSENWSKFFVHKFVSPPKIKAQLPKSQYENYLIALREKVLTRDEREKLLMTNVYAGYIFLIDSSYKIRWVGSGLPDQKEVDGLWKAVKGLEKELTLKSPIKVPLQEIVKIHTEN